MYRLVATVVLAVAVSAACTPVSTDTTTPATTAAPSTTASIATTQVPTSTTTSTARTLTRTSTTEPSTTTTSTPSTTLPGVEHLATGLFCRDLDAAGYTYGEAVTYWVREGSPNRMDADHNGIPCETVWPATDVVDFWGDPLPTTTTPSQRFEVDEPTYYPESRPGAGENFGSGCSPSTTSLPDGVWYGRIESESSTAIEFDLICFAPTPPEEDGVGRFTNSNPKLRTVPVASTATVHAIASDGFWELQPYSTWHLDPGQEGFCLPGGCWDVWLYVNNGHITEIVQLWFA